LAINAGSFVDLRKQIRGIPATKKENRQIFFEEMGLKKFL